MNKVTLFFIMACIFYLKGYAQQTEVLTLGVFHFDFPNLDMQQISEEDQIDVLSPVYQKEIELIANKLAKFRPDAIVIEHPVPDSQRLIIFLRHTLPENINFRKVKCNSLVSG